MTDLGRNAEWAISLIMSVLKRSVNPDFFLLDTSILSGRRVAMYRKPVSSTVNDTKKILTAPKVLLNNPEKPDPKNTPKMIPIWKFEILLAPCSGDETSVMYDISVAMSIQFPPVTAIGNDANRYHPTLIGADMDPSR